MLVCNTWETFRVFSYFSGFYISVGINTKFRIHKSEVGGPDWLTRIANCVSNLKKKRKESSQIACRIYPRVLELWNWPHSLLQRLNTKPALTWYNKKRKEQRGDKCRGTEPSHHLQRGEMLFFPRSHMCGCSGGAKCLKYPMMFGGTSYYGKLPSCIGLDTC